MNDISLYSYTCIIILCNGFNTKLYFKNESRLKLVKIRETPDLTFKK